MKNETKCCNIYLESDNFFEYFGWLVTYGFFYWNIFSDGTIHQNLHEVLPCCGLFET